MSNYIRSQTAGATYFFTLTLAQRNTKLLTENITLFRQAYQRANTLYPFHTIAICILPDHLHAIWQMPQDDGDYALRWRIIKASFHDNSAPAITVQSAKSNTVKKVYGKGDIGNIKSAMI